MCHIEGRLNALTEPTRFRQRWAPSVGAIESFIAGGTLAVRVIMRPRSVPSSRVHVPGEGKTSWFGPPVSAANNACASPSQHLDREPSDLRPRSNLDPLDPAAGPAQGLPAPFHPESGARPGSRHTPTSWRLRPARPGRRPAPTESVVRAFGVFVSCSGRSRRSRGLARVSPRATARPRPVSRPRPTDAPRRRRTPPGRSAGRLLGQGGRGGRRPRPARRRRNDVAVRASRTRPAARRPARTTCRCQQSCTSSPATGRWAARCCSTPGFGLDQMPCLDKLWTKESNWTAPPPRTSRPARTASPRRCPAQDGHLSAPTGRPTRSPRSSGASATSRSGTARPCSAWQHSEAQRDLLGRPDRLRLPMVLPLRRGGTG